MLAEQAIWGALFYENAKREVDYESANREVSIRVFQQGGILLECQQGLDYKSAYIGMVYMTANNQIEIFKAADQAYWEADGQDGGGDQFHSV